MPELIPQAIDEIRTLCPDVLVVTGDLIDVPFYGMDDPTTTDQVCQDLTLLKRLIDPVGCPVLYLFGNHDHPDTFCGIFSDAQPDVKISGYRFVTFLDEEVTDNFAERLGAERARFEAVLSDRDPTPQIHLQHYLIHPERNEGYPHAYREAEDLRSKIRSSGKVTLSLSGHYHKGEDLGEVDGTYFATARAFCEPPHTYTIYTIDKERVTQENYSIGATTLGKTLFIDLTLLGEMPNANLITTIRELAAEGWSTIGISPRGSGLEHERRVDQLMGQLDEQGFPTEAVIGRSQDGILFEDTADALGCQLSESVALLTVPAEAASAEETGLRSRCVASDHAAAIEALREITKQ